MMNGDVFNLIIFIFLIVGIFSAGIYCGKK